MKQDFLRRKREEANMSQEELAQKIGLTRQAISLIEIGTNTPTVDTAKKIGDILGFDWTEFYNDKVHS